MFAILESPTDFLPCRVSYCNPSVTFNKNAFFIHQLFEMQQKSVFIQLKSKVSTYF